MAKNNKHKNKKNKNHSRNVTKNNNSATKTANCINVNKDKVESTDTNKKAVDDSKTIKNTIIPTEEISKKEETESIKENQKETVEPIEETSKREEIKSTEEISKKEETESIKENQKETVEPIEEASKREEIKSTEEISKKEETESIKENQKETVEPIEEASKKEDDIKNNAKVNVIEQTKSKLAQLDLKTKLIISHCTVAILAASLTCTVVKNIDSSSRLNEDEIQHNLDEDENVVDKTISDIMDKLNENKLIKIQPTYPLDHSFDSIFDNIRDDATAIETSVLNSKEHLQEIFIIKTSDTSTAESELNKYKETLIDLYKQKNQKEELKIAKNIVIESKKGITYFIAAENYAEIKELINKEIK